MRLLRTHQTRHISTSGGSSSPRSSYPQKPPLWMRPNLLMGKHTAGWSLLRCVEGKA